MPIRPLAFANALAFTTALLGILLIVLRLFAPAVFVLIFNAQFFGADVAMLLPVELHVVRVIVECRASSCATFGDTPPSTKFVMNVCRNA